MKKVLSFLVLLFSFSAGKVFAITTSNSQTGVNVATWDDCIAAGTKDVATLACIPIVLQNLINFLVLFAGVVAVFLLIFAGFKFTTSQGDPEKVATARRTMIFVLWGALIIVASFAIVNLIAQFTGVSSLAPKP